MNESIDKKFIMVPIEGKEGMFCKTYVKDEKDILYEKGFDMIKTYLMSNMNIRIISREQMIEEMMNNPVSTQKFKEFDREKTLKDAASAMFTDFVHGVDYL